MKAVTFLNLAPDPALFKYTCPHWQDIQNKLMTKLNVGSVEVPSGEEPMTHKFCTSLHHLRIYPGIFLILCGTWKFFAFNRYTAPRQPNSTPPAGKYMEFKLVAG